VAFVSLFVRATGNQKSSRYKGKIDLFIYSFRNYHKNTKKYTVRLETFVYDEAYLHTYVRACIYMCAMYFVRFVFGYKMRTKNNAIAGKKRPKPLTKARTKRGFDL